MLLYTNNKRTYVWKSPKNQTLKNAKLIIVKILFNINKMKITFFLMKKFSLYFQELEKNNNKNCVLLRTIFLFEVWKTQKN